MHFLDDSLFPENQEKLVITAAPYGPEWVPSDFPEDIPVTMEAQVQKAVDCYNAGATALHLHVRELDGKGSKRLSKFNELIAGVRNAVPDLIIQVGGSISSSRMGAATHMLCNPCMQASCSTAVISSRVAPAFSARWMCRRTPGAYRCVTEASSAMPMSSIVFLSSAPAAAGAIASPIAFSVHAGSSLANGSQSGFQLPLAMRRVRVGSGSKFVSGFTAFFFGRFITRVEARARLPGAACRSWLVEDRRRRCAQRAGRTPPRAG